MGVMLVKRSLLILILTIVCSLLLFGARQMEYLKRGMVAIKTDEGVFLSWRKLGTDPEDVRFHIYRDGQRITPAPVSLTNFLDPEGTLESVYKVIPVIGGKERVEEASKEVKVWEKNYLEIPIRKPEGGVTPDGVHYEYTANDAAVGDLDGDGEYEIVLKWDPTNSKDNAHDGYTGNTYLDAYEFDGTHLWRIDLGRNIRSGAHYTPFIVYDLDGDGRAEVVCRTSDGTVDGQGNVIGDPNADYRNEKGRILTGPEYLTVFDGLTGRALVTVPFEPARETVESWGDNYGNRVDRFLMAVAYLDGQRPSVVSCRGYYARTALAAYNFRNGKLELLWKFDTKTGNKEYEGQGHHFLRVFDVDNDGRDEIIYGSCVIDDDGTGLFSTRLGHGDAMHFGDLDPTRPGYEVFTIHEGRSKKPYGVAMWDAKTGNVLWGVYIEGADVGRGLAADIDPRYPGVECWTNKTGLYTCKGEKISDNRPNSVNFAIWWDGDLLRELLDHTWYGDHGIGKIDKWDYINEKLVNLVTFTGTLSNNWTKGNPCLQADILGDWREEVIWRTEDSTALRVYVSTYPTNYTFYTLMHDPLYRIDIANQNVGYNQPPHTSFYLGTGMMETPPKPDIYVVK